MFRVVVIEWWQVVNCLCWYSDGDVGIVMDLRQL